MIARSSICRSDTLATNIYGYKNHAILYNKSVYISYNMADLWPLSISIESMGNILLLRDLLIAFNGKIYIGLESLGLLSCY